MKSIKELLELLLKEYDKYGLWGLCAAISQLYVKDLITVKEALKLRKYLREHVPVKSFYDYVGEVVSDPDKFWYPVGQIKERIEWLEKHIKLNS